MKGKIKKIKKAIQDESLNLRPCTSNPPSPAFVRRRRCSDCLYCQVCSLERCRLCRASKTKAPQKLSMAEQIALYDRLNKKKGTRKKKKL